MTSIRENWRIALLIVAVVASGFVLFNPTGDAAGANNTTAATGATQEETLTNLKYGLELSGGTRIQAPLEGWTAEGIQYDGDNQTGVETRVAQNLENVSVQQVELLSPAATNQNAWVLEVRSDVAGANPDEKRATVRSAVEAAGLSPEEVNPGVTATTREQTIKVLRDKIDETGIQGGRVRSVFSVTEQRYSVVVEVPNANRTEVLGLIEDPGRVQVRAYHPVQTDNGTTVYRNRTVLTNDDFDSVGVPQPAGSTVGPHVPVVVKKDNGVAERFQQDMVETGVAGQGGSSCGWPAGTGPCLLTVRDGEVVYSAGMNPSLAQSMRTGEWQKQPEFILVTGNFSEASALAVDLRAGALPTTLALDQGTARFVSPTFGANARLNALIAAIAAILAVSVVVAVRYGDVRVAIPMVLTGLAEVWLMLGFAAGIGLALDLSHIAGFIAVIGTGVDDLVIIADEILQEGDVATSRVFQSRFRKALWVIGAAAATTIIAMSPLAILNLQDLQGFAIVTIVGVLLGVLVTRPAYGDILRNLVLEEG
ncbi:preprotein translocase subunit SecD [Haloarculaceae archaeon H-GB2-1]|nr:preprotein translocase subunit SecD [Haloarculaceae archaeon H-GB1-1]MEA5388431.1 preprotein translocase subunit SecD [Haloarculaceae archaeon H-GB11]MEA5406466.1 preprotein translocase subunit SecD [Haloarculaceae archaeon H-GB2-1]